MLSWHKTIKTLFKDRDAGVLIDSSLMLQEESKLKALSQNLGDLNSPIINLKCVNFKISDARALLILMSRSFQSSLTV